MKKRICFIDDDDDEIALFDKVFADRFELVTGNSLDECRRRIEDRWGSPPDLFVLDLYFPHGIPNPGLLRGLKAEPPALVPDEGNLRRATQNYMTAEQRLMDLLRALGQTPQAGLDLAGAIRSSAGFSAVPMVFYSRNPTAEDYIRCMREDGVLDLIPKPTGATDEETRKFTTQHAPRIEQRFLKAMTPSSAAQKGKIAAAARQAYELLLKPFVEELVKQGATTLYKA